MLTCKQVSAALDDGDYMSLTRRKRFMLRMHVAMCIVCGKYNKQVMLFQDGIRKFLAREERPGATAPNLPDETRSRLERFAQTLAADSDGSGDAG
jgi:hypothetical protein